MQRECSEAVVGKKTTHQHRVKYQLEMIEGLFLFRVLYCRFLLVAV